MAKRGVRAMPEGMTPDKLLTIGKPGRYIALGDYGCDLPECGQVFHAVEDACECDFCNGIFCASHADYRVHGCLSGRAGTLYQPDVPLHVLERLL